MMKLAEALAQRADCQKRIEDLKRRIIRNATVQEGALPAENPAVLLEEIERASRELVGLVQRINRTNVAAELPPGQTLMESLAVRDSLGIRAKILRELAEAATVHQERYSNSELKVVSTVNVAAIQKQADDFAKQLRELDCRIQEKNWTTALVD